MNTENTPKQDRRLEDAYWDPIAEMNAGNRPTLEGFIAEAAKTKEPLQRHALLMAAAEFLGARLKNSVEKSPEDQNQLRAVSLAFAAAADAHNEGLTAPKVQQGTWSEAARRFDA